MREYVRPSVLVAQLRADERSNRSLKVKKSTAAEKNCAATHEGG
jgi:hypothetical protein